MKYKKKKKKKTDIYSTEGECVFDSDNRQLTATKLRRVVLYVRALSTSDGLES